MSEDKILNINKRSFFTVCGILLSLLVVCYILTFIIPQGQFNTETGEYIKQSRDNVSILKLIFAPFLVLGSGSGITLIVVSLFILIIGGVFNMIDKTGGIKSIISYLINKFQKKKYILMYVIILFFMLFGALFGIFEESMTLLPIIIILALGMGWDTFTGLVMCLMAAGFGFSSAITNPFSVGLASKEMGISILDGIWFRIIIFILMYIILCLFATHHVKKIEKDPTYSPSYEEDQKKRERLNLNQEFIEDKKVLKVYSIFFISILVIIIVSSALPIIQELGISVPIIAVSFLFGGFIACKCLSYSFKEMGKMFISGFVAMLPAVVMILLAGSIKYILDEGKIMDTIIHGLVNILDGNSPVVGIIFIYFVILAIQFFIGSASAKVVLIIPIIAILAKNLQISNNIALLSFVFGDGYTDLLYPTNPVLLISLGMSSFSYTKWIKKTWLLQIFILALTIGILILGHYIGV